jgi:hypothetical protein
LECPSEYQIAVFALLHWFWTPSLAVAYAYLPARSLDVPPPQLLSCALWDLDDLLPDGPGEKELKGLLA